LLFGNERPNSAQLASRIDSSYSRKGIQMYDIISLTIGGVISLPIVGFILLVSAVV
jgi:hypothetical protein